MDIDISDILADVSHLPSTHPSSALSAGPALLSDPQSTYQDHQALVRAWISERSAPDLLRYPTELIQRIMQRVREQIVRIEDMTSGGGEYETNGMGTKAAGTGNQNLNLVLSILQTDLSRTQFIVRSFLRQRLAKITKYAMFYLTQLERDTKKQLLSNEEIKFLQNHQALLSGLYQSSFLGGFPTQLRGLGDAVGGEKMAEGPDGLAAVVVRCLKDDGWENEVDGPEGDEGASVELRMGRGEVWVVRWRDVKDGVLHGDLGLL